MNILINNKKRNKKPNLVPLINIVFLLLIFFMLSGTLTKKDFFQVDPPESYTSANAESPEITVLISKNNKISIEDNFINKNDLKIILKNKLKLHNIDEVLIKADGDSDSGTLSDIIQIIRSVGIKRAAIVTKHIENN
mgnify:CR=1 FL=1|tara:strand:+ start:1201 stop:1611 length:411 start_codon:yes stop_codon:yes gene_type:complete